MIPTIGNNKGDRPNNTGRVYLIVFLLALAVRLIYLWESGDAPAFASPIVDAETYEQRALAWLATGRLPPMVFWQACLYHFFISGIFALSGGSIVAVKIIQALLGALTASLTAGIALSVFRRKAAGWIAGLGMALYGPAIYFDGELLATGVSVFIGTLLLWMMINKIGSKQACWMFILGILSMLAILTRPTFLPFFVVYWVWQTVSFLRKPPEPTTGDTHAFDSIWRPLAAWISGAAVLGLPFSMLSHNVSGRANILPPSGGINLYIGNSSNLCQTLTARPGPTWDHILHEPQMAGFTSFNDRQKYFVRKTFSAALQHPETVAGGLMRKTQHLLCSRELPRNSDPYLIHRWSRLQRVLMWKIRGFGFPFGVLAALAAVGIWAYRWKVPTVLYLFVVSYGAALILVHVAARYRMPIIPALIVIAAGGLLSLIDRMKLNPKRGYALISLACIFLILTSIPAAFCMERVNYAAEYYWAVGLNNVRDGKYDVARELYEASLKEDPDFAPALNGMGVEYGRNGRSEKARTLFMQAIEADESYAEPWWNLATLAAQSENRPAQIHALNEGLKRAPWNMRQRKALQQLITKNP